MRAPNDNPEVAFLTVKTDALDDAQRTAVETVARRYGGRVAWHASVRAARRYGLLSLPDRHRGEAVAAAAQGGVTVFESPVIALAVFPAVGEALPSLLGALTGAGRPDGVLACEPCDDGFVIEWNPLRTQARVILGLIDVELRRFNSARTIELLTPLAPPWVAKIASDGLKADEMAAGRVLEELIERADLHA
jgi:hypothetical protein